MPDKFIIHGATYNGDGTTSAEAASDGAAGAWNNINILTGTTPAYGTLAAGDTVYIRSKTSGGADITVNPGASVTLGSSAATIGAWVSWVLDAGTIWSGIDGTLTINTNGVSNSISLRNYNRYSCDRPDGWVLCESASGSSNKLSVALAGSNTIGLLIDLSAVTTGHGVQIQYGTEFLMRDCHVKSHTRYASLFAVQSAYGYARFVNCDIELLSAGETNAIWATGQHGAIVDVIGGRIRGAGAIEGLSLWTAEATTSGSFRALGLQFPVGINALPGVQPGQNGWSASYLAADGAAGGVHADKRRVISSRSDNNPPVLNAVLPDSGGSEWSWRVRPYGGSLADPSDLRIGKLYTQAPAAKTITLEFLLSTSFSGINKGNCWIDVIYIDDATGLSKYLTSQDFDNSALPSSSATWTTTTWGLVSFTKHKLSVTTPTDIKQDTMVICVLWFGESGGNSDHLLFVCPDVQLS